jgi:hypothetical protein
MRSRAQSSSPPRQRRALQERTSAHTNERSPTRSLRMVCEKEDVDDVDVYTATPFPTKPEQIFLPTPGKGQQLLGRQLPPVMVLGAACWSTPPARLGMSHPLLIPETCGKMTQISHPAKPLYRGRRRLRPSIVGWKRTPAPNIQMTRCSFCLQLRQPSNRYSQNHPHPLHPQGNRGELSLAAPVRTWCPLEFHQALTS